VMVVVVLVVAEVRIRRATVTATYELFVVD
jgi:hypothetical protein